MSNHEVERASTTEGLPVSPALGPTLEAADIPTQNALVDKRVMVICAISVLLAIAAAFIAQGLMCLINLVTNISFFGRASVLSASPAQNHLGAWVIVIPVIGGIIVGLMARYGSRAIRGHGIPEAMEQVLTNRSRIPARITFFNQPPPPFSIGTAGPFGGEGPSTPPAGGPAPRVGPRVPP